MSPEQWDWLRKAVEEIKRELAEAVKRSVKDWYTVEEFAGIVNRRDWTVREWCRLRRINAERLATRCGPCQKYKISHTELLRFRAEGLLPPPTKLKRAAA
jgi:hypothetical protein